MRAALAKSITTASMLMGFANAQPILQDSLPFQHHPESI
jgi:hypothetical protein